VRCLRCVGTTQYITLPGLPQPALHRSLPHPVTRLPLPYSPPASTYPESLHNYHLLVVVLLISPISTTHVQPHPPALASVCLSIREERERGREREEMREHHAQRPLTHTHNNYCRIPASHLATSAHPEKRLPFLLCSDFYHRGRNRGGLRRGSGVKLCATLKSDFGFLGSQSPKSLCRRFRARPFWDCCRICAKHVNVCALCSMSGAPPGGLLSRHSIPSLNPSSTR
jgi:hypothetical protein